MYVLVCLVLLLPLVLGFSLSIPFLKSLIDFSYYFSSVLCSLQMPGAPTRDQVSELLCWETCVQDGPLENERPYGILIGKSFPKGFHLSTKPRFHPTGQKVPNSQLDTLHQATQGHNSTD